MVRIPFEWLEFAFKSHSNGSNLLWNGWNWHLNARIPFEWFEFAFECVKSHSNGSNLLSNGLNPVRMLRICV